MRRPDFETVLVEEGPRPFNYTYSPPLTRVMQEGEDMDRATSVSHSPWYVTWCTDHLYEQCPAARRGDAWRAESLIYPDRYVGKYCGDLCGWCARIWRARHAGSKAGLPS